MTLDTKKDIIYVNQIIGQKSKNLELEGDIIVPDIKPDILNVINTNSNVCIYKKEILDGKARIDGSVNIYLIYLADNENEDIRSLSTNLDFTEIIDLENCTSGMNMEEKINVFNLETKILNGRKIKVKANMNTNVKIFDNKNFEIIKEINQNDNIEILNSNLNINSLMGSGTSKIYAKDTINIDTMDNLVEILKVDINIINGENKISYNKVLIKADAEIKIMFLTDDARIANVCAKIPMMGFVDIPNVSDTNICNMKYKLKNFLIKPNNLEEHSIYVEVEVETDCFVYENKNINMIDDLYCLEENLSFLENNIDTECYKESLKDTLIIKDKIPMQELLNSKIFDIQINTSILSENIINENVNYEGEVIIKCFYSQEIDNKFKVKTINVPFNHIININGLNNNSKLETNIQVKNVNSILLPDGNMDNNIELEFSIERYQKETIHVINEIIFEEKRDTDECSMIIYFVKTGDTLWKIAKKFKSKIEEIVKINDIENENKIYPGMQLFIPRYIKRKAS